MQMTLSGKGSKCRVCTHPDRTQIESMLARGAGIAAIQPMMGDAFSRRALYRHRAKHMIAAGLPAARPVLFPHSGSTLQKLKWLEREVEHTVALAEQKGDLGIKLKGLHLLGRVLWLETRLGRGEIDVTPEQLDLPEDVLKRLEDMHAERQAALATKREESPSPWVRYERSVPSEASERGRG
jgi:hypothetical protein